MENRIDAENVHHLIEQCESETLEFKKDNESPEKIGKYISALANSAALLGQTEAYMIWGIDDNTKEIVGTNFKPKDKKINGGVPFITWIEENLEPKIMINFEALKIEEKWVVVLIIQMNVGRPISFKGQQYIRSGSSIKNLINHQEKARALWLSFEARKFEREYALTNCKASDVFSLLDVEVYLKMLDYSLEMEDEDVLGYMIKDSVIEKVGDSYNITNLGAYCFAKILSKFENLKSRGIRLIRYKGNNKLEALEDITAQKGVVVGFEGLLKYIRHLLPLSAETYEENGQRVTQTDYPPIVIRELVANQIVHQDFSVKGSGPMIEIFDNRVEISNPGAPINNPNRLMDLNPISRNEMIADIFRRMHLVESRGSGIDKVIITLEMQLLPAPDILAKENYTVVILHERKKLADMMDSERNNALYWHAVRMNIEDSYMTNKSVRERFGLTPKQSSQATKAIANAVRSGLVKPYDETAGNKFMQYIPFWVNGFNE